MSTADHTTTPLPRHPYRDSLGLMVLFALIGPALIAATGDQLPAWQNATIAAVSALATAAGAAAFVYTLPGRAS